MDESTEPFLSRDGEDLLPNFEEGALVVLLSNRDPTHV